MQRAGQSCEKSAEREDGGVQLALIDAERAGQRPIFGSGSDDDAKARTRDEPRERNQHQRSDENQEQVVLRHRAIEYLQRAGEPRRTRT